MTKVPEKQRPLSADERALLEYLLQVDMPGIDELRAQMEWVEVREDLPPVPGYLNLWVPDEAPPARQVLEYSPIRAVSADDASQYVDVSVRMDGWYLGAISFVWEERDPWPLPTPEELGPPFRG